MMKSILRFYYIFLVSMVAACVPSNQKTVEVPVPTSTQIVEISTVPATENAAATEVQNSVIAIQDLQNISYFSSIFQKEVQLSNGEFSETGSQGTLSAILIPQTATGDLSGDQIDDAAVLVAENSGGNGDFVSLIVFVDQNGRFVQMGTKMIDDRPVIQSMIIQNNAIVLDGVIHGISDTMVEPTLGVVQTYRLLDNQLTLVDQKSNSQGGMQRSILIESPQNGDEISGTLQIKGSMPVAPFENNLRFSIFKFTGTPLYQSGFMITSADVGMPAVFDNEINLPSLPSGAWVRLELAELSMANGSILDMSSVIVKIK